MDMLRPEDSDGEEAGFPPEHSTSDAHAGSPATHLVSGASYSHLALQSFLTDMRVAMSLQHQNLVQLIGVTTRAPWGLCLVLERMDFPLEACLDSDEWQVDTSLPKRLYILAELLSNANLKKAKYLGLIQVVWPHLQARWTTT